MIDNRALAHNRMGRWAPEGKTMRLILALAGLFVSTAAYAHTGHGEASGFASGFMHPVGGLDHVLAMIAVGVLAFVAGGRALLVLPASFMAAMLAGGVLGMTGMELPLVEAGIAASIVVIAGLAALGYAMPVWTYGLVVAFFGIFHGFAHGAEMPLDASGYAYAAGFLFATGLLHLSGIAASFAGAAMVGRHGHMLARIGSGLLAMAGVGVMSGSL